MQPRSIIWFGRLLLFALAIDAVNNLIFWHGLEMNVEVARTPMLALALVPPVLGVALWYFVAKRASNIARWTITALVVVGVLGFTAMLARPSAGTARAMLFIAAFAEALKLAAICFLFTASASAWFAPNRSKH